MLTAAPLDVQGRCVCVWIASPKDEQPRGCGGMQASYNAWQHAVHPVPVIVSQKTLCLNLI